MWSWCILGLEKSSSLGISQIFSDFCLARKQDQYITVHNGTDSTVYHWSLASSAKSAGPECAEMAKPVEMQFGAWTCTVAVVVCCWVRTWNRVLDGSLNSRRWRGNFGASSGPLWIIGNIHHEPKLFSRWQQWCSLSLSALWQLVLFDSIAENKRVIVCIMWCVCLCLIDPSPDSWGCVRVCVQNGGAVWWLLSQDWAAASSYQASGQRLQPVSLASL